MRCECIQQTPECCRQNAEQKRPMHKSMQEDFRTFFFILMEARDVDLSHKVVHKELLPV